jgi:hypothetical protein
MSKKDQDALAAAGAAWNEANARGDKAGMEAAHAQAESIRANYGYSGGADGSQYIPTSKPSAGGQYVGVGKGSDYYAGQNMSTADQAQLKGYGDQYNAAIAAGDRDAAAAAHAAAEALRAQYGYSGGGDGSDYIQLAKPTTPSFSYDSAPTYSDPYSARIDEMLNDILNRDKFSYNAAEDDLYQQYKAQYTREGQRAMQDTLGQVAARTGGMASSYATTAAQQQNNYYMAQLSDKIPELYQLAYQMYLDDIDLQVQDLGLLQNASNTAYDRYRDTMSDWRDDRDFAYGMYRDDIADGQWQTSFDRNVFESDRDYDRGVFESDRNYDYNVGRDQVEDERYEREWDYNVGRDAVEDSRYDQEWAYKLAQDALNAGNSGDADDNGGKDVPVKANGEKDWSKAESESLTGGLTGTEYLEQKQEEEATRNLWASINALGIGPISATFAEELMNYGGIVETANGTVKWANGWNASNYEEKLKAAKASNPVVGALGNALSGFGNFGI